MLHLFLLIQICMRCLQYAVENEELSQHLAAAKDAQRQLTAEVTSKSLFCLNHISLFAQFFNDKRCI